MTSPNRSWGTDGDHTEHYDRNATSRDPNQMIEMDLGPPRMPDNMWQALMETVPNDTIPESLEEVRARMEPLLEAMRTLPRREQYVLEARYWEQKSLRELAEVLPWSKSQIHRIERHALDTLATALNADHGGYRGLARRSA